METAIKYLMKYECIYAVFVVCMWCILTENCLFCCLRCPPSRNSLTSCPYHEHWKSEGLGDGASDPFPVSEAAEGTPPLHSPTKVWNTVD